MNISIETAAKKAFCKLIHQREIKVWQGHCHWIESNPDVKGDYLVVLEPDGEKETLVDGDDALGNHVHEYGGGDYAIHVNGDIYFIRQKDQQICRYHRQTKVIDLITTGDQHTRYADIDLSHDVLIAIQEVHHEDDIVNRIISINLDTLVETTVAEGHDFYASPRFNKDGKLWAYLYWNHPNMPWHQCQLCYGRWYEQGVMQTINTSNHDVISQFCWTSQNQLLYTSDQTGWANVYLDGKPLYPAQMHFGFERWQQGQQNIAVMDNDVCIAIAGPPEQRVLGKIVNHEWHVFDLPCCDYLPFMATEGENLFVIGAFIDAPPKILRINVISGKWSLLEENKFNHDQESVVPAKPIQFPSLDGAQAHAFFYDAQNFHASETLPPLLVLCHGGPTAATSPQWDPMIQFWVNQGISVVDVNYRGSTGYGRAYQDALEHQWGIIDVEDCVAARDYLVDTRMVDPKRCFIRGKSSGGLTTLRALMYSGKFAAGGCYYGVSDLMQLLKITHKFEQCYLDYLIGGYPEEEKRYIDRSPTYEINKIKVPIIFFHGLLDKVVPPSQTIMMVDALEAHHVSCEYHAFPNEKHGFKQLENKITALVKECFFYKCK